MKFDVKIEGLDQLQRTLKEFPADMRKKALVSGMRKGARILRDEVIQQAPEGENRSFKQKKAWTIKAIRIKPHHKNMYIVLKPNYNLIPHFHLVELGTKQRVQETTGRETGITPPNPFFRRGFEIGKQKAVNAVGEQVIKYLRNQMKKLR